MRETEPPEHGHRELGKGMTESPGFRPGHDPAVTHSGKGSQPCLLAHPHSSPTLKVVLLWDTEAEEK